MLLNLHHLNFIGFHRRIASQVRMAEWSKAPDSSSRSLLGLIVAHGRSGPRMWAWVRIPLLTELLEGQRTIYAIF